MCGIIGYTGNRAALPVLLGGLAALEYRGYDSAGVACHGAKGLQTVKRAGRLSCLAECLRSCEELQTAACGIGHTRWATHGAPVDCNAHPHATARLAMAHNGIIENYAELGALLKAEGYTFASETDTESALLLVDRFYAECRDPVKAIFSAVRMLRGAFALVITFADLPERIYAIRRDNPLIVAAAEGASLVASDVTAILSYTKEYYRPQEGVLCELTPERVVFYGENGELPPPPSERVDWDVTAARKEGWPHFMLKEIHEEPLALRRTVSHYLREGLPYFGVDATEEAHLSRLSRVHIVACGTAMHAGLIGRHMIEKLTRVPTFVEIASEFRYRDPVLSPDDLVILLSQSGETADTLAALRHAKAQGVRTLAVVNVVGSSVAREADSVLYTVAGPEIAVASTKAYSVQCAVLCLLAIHLGLLRGCLHESRARELCASLLQAVPHGVEQVLGQSEEICRMAAELAGAGHLFYIGRDVDHALCTEGSLKLKEISYIHSEAYAAGELKHGTISLIESGTPVVAVMTCEHLAEKMISGIREVRARGASVLAILTQSIAEAYDVPADTRLVLPVRQELPAPFAAATALQLLAYHTAAQKGLDVDKPRNLAKSVTVE